MGDILKTVVGPLIQILADMFGGAGKDGLRQSMKTLFNVLVPDFSVAWFKTLYSPSFALGILIALVVTGIVMFRHKYETGGTLGGAVNGLIYTPIVYIKCLVLPVVLAIGLFVAGVFSSGIMSIFGAKDSSAVDGLLSIAGTNPIDSLGFGALVWVVSHLLAIEVWVITNSLYLGALAGPVVIAGRGLSRFNDGLYENLVGFFLVALSTKPAMLLVLLPGQALAQNTVGGAVGINLVTLYVAAFVPFFLYWMYHHSLAQRVGGRVDVDGTVTARSRGITKTAVTAAAATAGAVITIREIHQGTINDDGNTSAARTAGIMAKGIADGAAMKAAASGHPEVAIALKATGSALGYVTKPRTPTSQQTTADYDMPRTASREEGNDNGGYPNAHSAQQT